MNGEATVAEPRRIWGRRLQLNPAIEIGLLALAIGVAIATYFIVRSGQSPKQLLTPPLVASLLVANLVCIGSLIVLFGRRIAKRRAARSEAGGRAQLHVRLVAIFSILASVPTVLLAVIASVLFQYGAEFWSSGRVRDVIENSKTLAEASYDELISYVEEDRQQRAATVLRDVGYVINAHFELTAKAGPDDNVGKHLDIFNRRARRGQCFQAPCLGTREFSASFELIEDDAAPPVTDAALAGERDLGWMLHDIDFADGMMPRFFRAHMVDGYIEVPAPDHAKVRA